MALIQSARVLEGPKRVWYSLSFSRATDAIFYSVMGFISFIGK